MIHHLVAHNVSELSLSSAFAREHTFSTMEPVTALERLVLAHPERNWRWAALPAHLEIRPEFVYAHPELPWSTDWAIYENTNMTPEWLSEHPSIDIDWNAYSKNPSLTKEFLCANLDKEWNWVRLSSNPAITSDVVEHLLEEHRAEWYWGQCGLSKNPSMTYTFVEDHPEMPWCFDTLSLVHQRGNRVRMDTELDSYRRVTKRTTRLRHQLMRVAWHPTRFQDWCLSQEDKAELG